MLSPRYLEGVSDEIVEIYAQLETDILADMARRIARLGKNTASTQWQAQLLAETGALKKDVNRIIQKYDKQVRDEIQAIYNDATIKNARADNKIFRDALGHGVSDTSAQIMLASIQKTYSDLSRLTITTAYTTEQNFIQQANSAYMQVVTGACDYDTAMKNACDNLASEGITAVQYRNSKPVRLGIESAVRMNILTGVNQTAANITLNNCEELGCDLVETSAHIGARPEHEAWQGKIFSLSGTSKKYPPFSVCGLGEAGGICGINCRHSYYPYFEGMEKHWTQDDLDELAAEKVTFNGKEITRYEGEQKLRGIERTVRAYKRRALTEEAAGVDSTAARRKIGKWQATARDFTRQTGIKRDSVREFVGTVNGKQPAGIRTMTAGGRFIPITETDAAVQAVSAFPEEIWQEKSPGVFVAKGREPKTKQQIAIFKKESEMARILAQNGHTVYMLPETSAGKNPDVIMDGVKTEFKTVTGNIRAVGTNFRHALQQGVDVFIRTSGKTSKEIYSKIVGETKILMQNNALLKKHGNIYIWIDGENILYKWKLEDVVNIAKNL